MQDLLGEASSQGPKTVQDPKSLLDTTGSCLISTMHSDEWFLCFFFKHTFLTLKDILRSILNISYDNTRKDIGSSTGIWLIQ